MRSDAPETVVDRILRGYCRLLEVFLVVCLTIMVALVFGNVVLRYAFNSGITISEELSRWLFVWLTFMGAVIGLREHSHLGSEMLFSDGSEAVELCLAICLGHSPFRGEKPFALEPVECRIQCAFAYLQSFLCRGANPVSDGVAVERSPAHRFENDQIERSGENVRAGHGHAPVNGDPIPKSRRGRWQGGGY